MSNSPESAGLQVGELVGHAARAEWGTGVVTNVRGDGKIEVAFEHTELKVLSVVASQQHLLRGQGDSVPSDHPLRDPRQWRTLALAPDKRVNVAGRKKCDHCGKLLRTSTYSAAKDWKSCPKCSTVDGHQHVFYEYPSAFGPTDPTGGGDTSESAKSYCHACRAGETPRVASRACANANG